MADHEAMVAVDEESLAELSRAVMAVPETLDWAPGLVTDTVLVMVQVKLAEPLKVAGVVGGGDGHRVGPGGGRRAGDRCRCRR